MKLPRVSGMETLKALTKLGYQINRQRGSHIMLTCVGKQQLVVPNHRELDNGTLRQIIKDAGLAVEEFIQLL